MSLLIGNEPLTHACILQSTSHSSFQLCEIEIFTGLAMLRQCLDPVRNDYVKLSVNILTYLHEVAYACQELELSFRGHQANVDYQTFFGLS
jgi:hypothetical protein